MKLPITRQLSVSKHSRQLTSAPTESWYYWTQFKPVQHREVRHKNQECEMLRKNLHRERQLLGAVPNWGLGFIGLASPWFNMAGCKDIHRTQGIYDWRRTQDTGLVSNLAWLNVNSLCVEIYLVSSPPGWCATVLFNGVGAGRGREAVVRAGDDHEEAMERLRGSSLLPEVTRTPDSWHKN